MKKRTLLIIHSKKQGLEFILWAGMSLLLLVVDASIIAMILAYLLLIVVFASFREFTLLRVDSTRIEWGVKKGFRKALLHSQFMPITDFLGTEVVQNEEKFFEIYLLGKGGQRIFISKDPNRLPAEKKASKYELEIQKHQHEDHIETL